MPEFDIVPGLHVVTRDTWGANPNHPRRGAKVARNRRTHVIIHHTVMVDSDDTPNIWERKRDIFKMMRRLQVTRPDLGLDVPYNFVAFLSANNDGLHICEGRGEDRTGAHTKGHNTKGIAVSFAGNFHNKPIDPVEIARRMPLLSFFLGWLRFDPSHPDYGDFKPLRKLDSFQPQNRHVFFHRDFKATACPGAKLMPHLPQVGFVAPPH
jgi:hypothetical protein